MSGGGVGQGAVYSPLPQSISDTDSSEEELNNTVHQNDNSKLIANTKETVDKHNNGKKMGEYRQLGHDGEGEVSVNGLPSRDHCTTDDIPIIKPDTSLPHHMEPMSPLRRVCFILSILLCGLTIVTFLWLLPCDWATCPSAPLRSGAKSWETTLEGLELKGGISVVAGVPGRGRNLVFLARGDIINAALGKESSDNSMKTFPPNGGGLVSLIGSTGKVAWYIHFSKMPHDMDCTLIDVTNDGAEDCIILGSGNQLVAVDPIPGSILWYVHNHNETGGTAVDMLFPFVLPDLDGDGINDMVTTCSFNQSDSTVTPRNNLILISGRMGKIIGQAFTVSNCPNITDMTVGGDWNIYYFCNFTNESNISVVDIYRHATNKELNASVFLHLFVKQHNKPGISKKIYKAIGSRRLNLLNEGTCPNQCNVSVRVTNTPDWEPIWYYIQKDTYGMIPVVVMFNNRTGTASGGTSAEPVCGFVLKFWTWITRKSHIFTPSMKDFNTNMTSSNPLFRSRLKRSLFDISLENSEVSHRFQRSVKPTLQQIPKNESIPQLEVHQLKERVVLFTFNATDNHIVNTSLHDITQLCYLGTCQPDLSFQEQSLLFADLDEDGSQELISFLTTYTTSDPDNTAPDADSTRWHLQSRVRVVRLEAELPKLYEAVSRQ